MKTRAALAAAMIRKEIKAKFPELKFTCRSENYAGGNSINIGIVDQPVDVKNAIEEMTAKYEYGHFDGMTDCYHYSNSRDDIPQVKFLFVNNDMTDAKREEIYQAIKKGWAGGDELPDTYDAARNVHFQGHYIQDMVWRGFTGAIQI